MQDTVATGWRRFSDEERKRKHADSGSTRSADASLIGVPEAQQPVRILIVDNDMRSSESLELMLHASGYSETRVAYSGEAALAIAAEFRPSVVLLEVDLLD